MNLGLLIIALGVQRTFKFADAGPIARENERRLRGSVPVLPDYRPGGPRPFFVRVEVTQSESRRRSATVTICSGTIVSPQLVLAFKECFKNYGEKTIFYTFLSLSNQSIQKVLIYTDCIKQK